MSDDKLREKIARKINYFIYDDVVQYVGLTPEGQFLMLERADQIIALLPDMELLKKQIEGVKANAFSVSLFGDREHQLKMDAMVSAYDVVLNKIKEMGDE